MKRFALIAALGLASLAGQCSGPLVTPTPDPAKACHNLAKDACIAKAADCFWLVNPDNPDGKCKEGSGQTK